MLCSVIARIIDSIEQQRYLFFVRHGQLPSCNLGERAHRSVKNLHSASGKPSPAFHTVRIIELEFEPADFL
jgi:hypothetical protein